MSVETDLANEITTKLEWHQQSGTAPVADTHWLAWMREVTGLSDAPILSAFDGRARLACPRPPDRPSTPTLVLPATGPHPFDRVREALRAHGSRMQPKQDARHREAFRATCPAHADANPSLVVTRDTDTVLLRCFGGCRTAHVVAALGLKMADLFAQRVRPARRREVARYTYCDLAGEILGVKVRFAPKGFRWQEYSAKVGPYCLPDLIDARTVFLTEGEKGCDRLWAMGLPATCGPGGAGRWRPEWSHALWTAGCRELVVLADNDPAGRNHAEVVAAITFKLTLGVDVKIVLLPGLPITADVVDWLDAGHDGEELVGLVAETPVWSPELPEQHRLARRRQRTLARVRRYREKQRLMESPNIRSVTPRRESPAQNIRSVTPASVTRNAVTLPNVLLDTSQVSLTREASLREALSLEEQARQDEARRQNQERQDGGDPTEGDDDGE